MLLTYILNDIVHNMDIIKTTEKGLGAGIVCSSITDSVSQRLVQYMPKHFSHTVSAREWTPVSFVIIVISVI